MSHSDSVVVYAVLILAVTWLSLLPIVGLLHLIGMLQ